MEITEINNIVYENCAKMALKIVEKESYCIDTEVVLPVINKINKMGLDGNSCFDWDKFHDELSRIGLTYSQQENGDLIYKQAKLR